MITRDDFPVAIASYSFHGLHGKKRLDVFGYLESLRYRYDVGHADIWSGLLDSLEPEYLDRVRAALDERGLVLANLCVDGPHLWEDDPATRAQHHDWARQYLAAAVRLGARTVRIDMGHRGETLSTEQLDYIVATYREYAVFGHDHGFRVGPENHWGASRVPANLVAVRRGVDHPGYGHLFHFGNFVEGRAEEGLAAVLPVAMHTHIAANTVTYAKEYIRALKLSGYPGVFSVEHHSSRLEYERVAWQLATVRGMIAELVEEGLDTPAAPPYFNEIYGVVPVAPARDTNPLLQDVLYGK